MRQRIVKRSRVETVDASTSKGANEVFFGANARARGLARIGRRAIARARAGMGWGRVDGDPTRKGNDEGECSVKACEG